MGGLQWDREQWNGSSEKDAFLPVIHMKGKNI